MASRKISLFLLVVLGLVGFLSVLIATRWGIGVSPDSVSYLNAAENIAAGRGYSMQTPEGYTESIIHWPPLYSGLLAGLGRIGVGIPLAARILNAVLLAASLLILWLMLYPFVGDSRLMVAWLGLSLLLLFIAPPVSEIHLMAWSEPLFIFLTMSALLCLSWYLDHQRIYLIVAAAIITSLSVLTRYSGAALVISGSLGILLISRSLWMRRFIHAGIYLIVSLAPAAIWLAVTSLSSEAQSSRPFSFHPLSTPQLSQAITTLTSWLLISSSAAQLLKVMVIVVFAAIVVVMMVLGVRSRADTGKQPGAQSHGRLPSIIKLVILYIIVYPIFLAFSFSFFDANIPFDGRILSPIFVSGLVLVCYAVTSLKGTALDRPKIWTMLGVIGVIICVGYFNLWIKQMNRSFEEGIGLNNRAWQQSPTLAEVKRLPDTAILYSNVPEGIFFQTGRFAFSLPRKYLSLTQSINEDYGNELDNMEASLLNNDGLIVYFNIAHRTTLPEMEELKATLPLCLISQFPDGTIYTLQSAK